MGSGEKELCSSCPVASNVYTPLEQVTFPFRSIHFILHDERKQKPVGQPDTRLFDIGGAFDSPAKIY